jgi:hypothetical protein
MTKYARDEFDRVPETSSRQGVHRVASDAPRRRLGPILAVGIAALAIGLVAFLFLPKLGLAPTGNPLIAAGSAVDSPSATPSAGAPQSSAPAATEPSTAPSASASSSTSPEIETQSVDKTRPVAVYNGTTTAGLAGRVGSSVSAAGWTLGPVGNWGGMPQKSSVIYYNGAEQKANAEALGDLLNITSLVDSPEFKQPVVVVLGPGFR